MAGPTSHLPFWRGWTRRAARVRFTIPCFPMDTWHVSTVIMENSKRFHTGVRSSVGQLLSNLTSLPSPCSYLPHPQSMNRESSTTEGYALGLREGASPPPLIVSSVRNFEEMQWVWGCRPLPENTTNCVAPVSLWTKASTKLVFFCFFLSNEYLCTILVLLSYLLIIEPLTWVTWCHLLILGCQCPQCGFTMQLRFWTRWCWKNLTHQSSWRLKSSRLA